MGSTRNLAILGAGGHALSVADAAESSGWSVVACIAPPRGAEIENVSRNVVDSLSQIDWATTHLALGVGLNYLREAIYLEEVNVALRERLATIVHATAWVSPRSKLNPGSVVLAHAVVGPDCAVGVGAILNTASSLDHGSILSDFSSLGPGSRTGGDARVGERSHLGLNASLLQNRTIGADTVIGGNSVVTTNMPGSIVAWGSPCRQRRARHRDDPYL